MVLRMPGSRADRLARLAGVLVALLAIAPLTPAAGAAVTAPPAASPAAGADFRGVVASTDARVVADWVVTSRDNHALPFIVIDKVAARVFVFDRGGSLLGAAPALLGLGHGDDSVPGIGQRRLATISPAERTTPAGRFEASLGHDFEQDLLWIDYDAALSLHRVIVGNPRDHRAERLASPSVLDNRISYGCINVPARFYDAVVAPAFAGTAGIVYILPETRPIGAVFAISGQRASRARGGLAAAR